jgi:hypothetical protein
MLCSQVGETLHKHLQCTEILKNALSGTGTLVLGWDDYEKSKRLDKSAMQLNFVLLDCLLDINPTALYNKSFLQDSLMHVDRLLAGRLSKAANGTKWADEGSKLLHLCFMELRRTYRNSRIGERHAPWLKSLLNNMHGDANPGSQV